MDDNQNKDDQNKTDWSFIEPVLKKVNTPAAGSGHSTLSLANVDLPTGKDATPPTVPSLAVPNKNAARGILMKYRENKLNRKSTLQALELTYKTQLDALTHTLTRALQVKKTETDVIAEEYLKELDARHMEVMNDLGLRNIDIRNRTLEKLNDQYVAKIKEIKDKDWPPDVIIETLELMSKLRMRFIAEMMTEVGLDHASE